MARRHPKREFLEQSGALHRLPDRVRADLSDLRLPEAVTAEVAGQDEELRVSFNSLKLALALAIFLVYTVGDR